MITTIVLDSGPLGLIVHKLGVKAADDCRSWLSSHLQRGTRVVVPEIVDYELRRELLRMGKTESLADLEVFESAVAGRFVPLTTVVLQEAAVLWADARKKGVPTAHAHALDCDVILASQALNLGLPKAEYVVATGNVAHLSRFVPAAEWPKI